MKLRILNPLKAELIECLSTDIYYGFSLLNASAEETSISSPEAIEIFWLSSGKPGTLNHYNPVNPV